MQTYTLVCSDRISKVFQVYVFIFIWNIVLIKFSGNYFRSIFVNMLISFMCLIHCLYTFVMRLSDCEFAAYNHNHNVVITCGIATGQCNC